MNLKEHFKRQLIEDLTINDYYSQPPALPPIGDPIVPLTPPLSRPTPGRPGGTVGRPQNKPIRGVGPGVGRPAGTADRGNPMDTRPGGSNPGGGNPGQGGGNPGFKVPGSNPIDLRVPSGRQDRKVNGQINRGMRDGRARP